MHQRPSPFSRGLVVQQHAILWWLVLAVALVWEAPPAAGWEEGLVARKKRWARQSQAEVTAEELTHDGPVRQRPVRQRPVHQRPVRQRPVRQRPVHQRPALALLPETGSRRTRATARQVMKYIVHVRGARRADAHLHEPADGPARTPGRASSGWRRAGAGAARHRAGAAARHRVPGGAHQQVRHQHPHLRAGPQRAGRRHPLHAPRSWRRTRRTRRASSATPSPATGIFAANDRRFLQRQREHLARLRAVLAARQHGLPAHRPRGLVPGRTARWTRRRPYYTPCTYNGVTLQAHHHAHPPGGRLPVRRRGVPVHRELRHRGTYDNCKADCGACP